MIGSVVVVGASLAGMHAAQTLRARASTAASSVSTPTPSRPTTGRRCRSRCWPATWDADRIALPAANEDLDLDLRLGRRAMGLDLAERFVRLDGGDRVGYDGLVHRHRCRPRDGSRAASDARRGARAAHARRLPARCAPPSTSSPSRVVVVGAGFIGAEVAATCRARGLEVTLLEALPGAARAGARRTRWARSCADLHRDHGVDLRLGVGVDGFEGTDHGRGAVRLADGSSIEAEVVVVGIGVAPNTDWLEGSGLDVDDGVVCDETSLAAPGVVAAGDIARWPIGPLRRVLLRVEHWETAIADGRGRRPAPAGRATPAPSPSAFDPVPVVLERPVRPQDPAGRPSSADDEVEVVDGSLDERRFVALYGRDGTVVGVLGMNRPAHVVRLRRLVEDRCPWDEGCRSGRLAMTLTCRRPRSWSTTSTRMATSWAR